MKKLIKSLPLIGPLAIRVNTLMTRVPAGHFYSPIVSAADIKKREHQIYSPPVNAVNGIDLNEENQISLLREAFAKYGKAHTFSPTKQENARYFYENNYYKLTDATGLYLILCHFKPKKIIEVGSGFSSAVTLDTIDSYFETQPELTFIEPYPDRLKSLLNDSEQNIKILEKNLQDVPVDFFKSLEEDDILFIDSTHVSKTGSDVNFFLFEIFPILNPGVIIHIHDIFYPFEYPKDWVIYGNGRFGWNEAYVLRAFLSNQDNYEIILFNNYLQTFHQQWLSDNIPAYSDYGKGGSIWLRKKVVNLLLLR